MKTYTAQYQVGEHVFTIGRGTASREVNCTPCENSGRVTIGGAVYDCPGCHGRGKQSASVEAWSVSDEGPVGRVEITEMGAAAAFREGGHRRLREVHPAGLQRDRPRRGERLPHPRRCCGRVRGAQHRHPRAAVGCPAWEMAMTDRQLLDTAVGLLRRDHEHLVQDGGIHIFDGPGETCRVCAFLASFDALAAAPREGGEHRAGDRWKWVQAETHGTQLGLQLGDMVELVDCSYGKLGWSWTMRWLSGKKLPGTWQPWITTCWERVQPPSSPSSEPHPEQTAEELRARIVQQGRNRVRVQERLGVGYAELRSFVDWIETMDRDATVPMEARPLTEGERTAEQERADVVAWLREQAVDQGRRASAAHSDRAARKEAVHSGATGALSIAATRIEGGDHLKPLTYLEETDGKVS